MSSPDAQVGLELPPEEIEGRAEDYRARKREELSRPTYRADEPERLPEALRRPLTENEVGMLRLHREHNPDALFRVERWGRGSLRLAIVERDPSAIPPEQAARRELLHRGFVIVNGKP